MGFQENFQDFCGGPLWDVDMTWNTRQPDFTPCFHRTMLAWAPATLLFLLSPLEWFAFRRSKSRGVPWTWLNLSKSTAMLGLVAVAATELGFVVGSDDEPEAAGYLAVALFLASYLYALLLHVLSLRYGRITSGVQFVFWLASVVCHSVTVRSLALDLPGSIARELDRDKALALYSVQLGLCIVVFLLSFFADATPAYLDPVLASLDRPCPRHSSSFFTNLMFDWETPLIWRGFRQPLDTSNLWDVDRLTSTRGIVPPFDAHLERSARKARAKDEPVSLFPPLFYTFGPKFFLGVVFKVIADLFSLASPQIMSLMMDYVSAYADPTQKAEEEWKGYLYAATILVVTFTQSLLNAHSSKMLYMVGMQVRTAVTSVIYRKSLRMSSAARNETTMGEVVNLMAVDSQRFMDVMPYLYILW